MSERQRAGAGGAPGCRLLVARRAVVQRGDAPDAQRRAVVRRRGREHCVQEHQYQDAQLESGAAQSARRGRCEGRPVTRAAGPPRPSGGLAGALLSPDVTAFGVVVG